MADHLYQGEKGSGDNSSKTNLDKDSEEFIIMKTCFQFFFVVCIYLTGILTNCILGKHILWLSVYKPD